MTIQATPPRPSYALPVIAGNLVPLAGVVLWGWDIFELMFLYWAENIVIGLLTMLAMPLAALRGGAKAVAGAVLLALFFLVHYGIFCLAHGVFVIELFYQGDLPHNFSKSGLFAAPLFAREIGLWHGFFWALAGMALVQLVRLVAGWPALAARGAEGMMIAPYGRIIVLHFTLLLGGMLVMALGAPAAALVLLIVLKTLFDLGIVHIGANQRKDAHDEPATDR